MFSNCSSLEELNISSFCNNSNTDMDYIFENSSSLEKFNISDLASINSKMFKGYPKEMVKNFQNKIKIKITFNDDATFIIF